MQEFDFPKNLHQDKCRYCHGSYDDYELWYGMCPDCADYLEQVVCFRAGKLLSDEGIVSAILALVGR